MRGMEQRGNGRGEGRATHAFFSHGQQRVNEKIRPIRGSVPALSMSKIYRIPRPISELDPLIEVPSWLSDRQAWGTNGLTDKLDDDCIYRRSVSRPS